MSRPNLVLVLIFCFFSLLYQKIVNYCTFVIQYSKLLIIRFTVYLWSPNLSSSIIQKMESKQVSLNYSSLLGKTHKQYKRMLGYKPYWDGQSIRIYIPNFFHQHWYLGEGLLIGTYAVDIFGESHCQFKCSSGFCFIKTDKSNRWEWQS